MWDTTLLLPGSYTLQLYGSGDCYGGTVEATYTESLNLGFSADLDRSGIVNLADFVLFAEEWLLEMDTDGDGFVDSHDNCPHTPNPNQMDTDGDGVGDACDNYPDIPNLVINEIYYDEEGTDGPNIFIELWGPPGTSLDRYELLGYNPVIGNIYATIPLSGYHIGSDGYFLIVHPDANATLMSLADMVSPLADLQDGPDLLAIFYDNQLQIDLVGYGEDPYQYFEGTAPAPDSPAGLAISRDMNHTDTDDNAADFQVCVPSPRANPTGCN